VYVRKKFISLLTVQEKWLVLSTFEVIELTAIKCTAIAIGLYYH